MAPGQRNNFSTISAGLHIATQAAKLDDDGTPPALVDPTRRYFAAIWLNQTGQPVTSILTSFTVPLEPQIHRDQVVYIFPGLQSFDRILQPVLQWGRDTNGVGGPYWALTSFCAGPPGSDFIRFSGSANVAPGTPLTARIARTGKSTGGWAYECGFDGYPETHLQVPDLPELDLCTQAFEVYRVADCSEYPISSSIMMTDIVIMADEQILVPNWDSAPAFSRPCGEFVKTTASNQVELIFRNQSLRY